MSTEEALTAAKQHALETLNALRASIVSRVEDKTLNERSPVDTDNVQDVDYKPEPLPTHVVENAPEYEQLLEAAKRFTERGIIEETSPAHDTNGETDNNDNKAKENSTNKTDDGTKKDADAPLSRRQRKLHVRTLIAKLKGLAARPDLVDAWDVSANDPLLLVHLKAWPNSVQVPANWRQKRKYLQNKRGMEKRVFQLPSYIADTGVGEIRDAQMEADDKKTLKQKQREKMRAKSGKGVEIDDTALHDAFFKFQTKPRLTPHGDLYYEMREMEVDNSKFRPGHLSDALRAALGITPSDPPPWLIAMQRYGPPPGYPSLKVPGLNAPIPPGASFGYQPGGWGKPPVDVTGKPIYGDVFGEGRQYEVKDSRFDATERQKRTLWGEMKSEDELLKSFANERATTEDEESPAKKRPKVAGADLSSGTESAGLPQLHGLETPRDGIELRKGVPQGSLYTVLPEQKASVGRGDLLGSSHTYDMASTAPQPAPPTSAKSGPGTKENDPQQGAPAELTGTRDTVAPGDVDLTDGTMNEGGALDMKDRVARRGREVGKDERTRKEKSFKF